MAQGFQWPVMALYVLLKAVVGGLRGLTLTMVILGLGKLGCIHGVVLGEEALMICCSFNVCFSCSVFNCGMWA